MKELTIKYLFNRCTYSIMKIEQKINTFRQLPTKTATETSKKETRAKISFCANIVYFAPNSP